jgi:hypothetical protein
LAQRVAIGDDGAVAIVGARSRVDIDPVAVLDGEPPGGSVRDEPPFSALIDAVGASQFLTLTVHSGPVDEEYPRPAAIAVGTRFETLDDIVETLAIGYADDDEAETAADLIRADLASDPQLAPLAGSEVDENGAVVTITRRGTEALLGRTALIELRFPALGPPDQS